MAAHGLWWPVNQIAATTAPISNAEVQDIDAALPRPLCLSLCAALQQAMHSVINASLTASCPLPASSARRRAWRSTVT
jgi:hypothetical protein